MVGKEAIYEYDELMIGNRRSISPDFFSFGDSANETMALGIMKYAFETYLRWDPIDLRDRIDTELLKSLRLLPLLRYIRFSEELDPNTDLFYIVWKIYPWTVNYSYEERVFRVYRNVLKGKICRFPKEFFSGTEGETRAKLCFRYMLEHIMPFPSVNEIDVQVLRDAQVLGGASEGEAVRDVPRPVWGPAGVSPRRTSRIAEKRDVL